MSAGVATLLALWDLSAGDMGFVPTGDTEQWAHGVPKAGPRGSAAVWGTVLDGPHLNDAQDALEIALPDLAGAVDPVLVLRHWYDLRPGDVGLVQVDDGSGWRTVEPAYGYPSAAGITGASGDWVETSVPLAPGDLAVRLLLVADATGAGDGWYLAEVALFDGDATPPNVTPVSLPSDTQDLAGPYLVRARAVDDAGEVDVRVAYAAAGVAGEVPATVDGDTFVAAIPGQPPGTVVTWRAVASDGALETLWPADHDASFRVFLAAPTGLAGPSGRVVGHAVELTWAPPTSPHAVLGYEVEEEGGAITGAAAPPAVVPLAADGGHVWRVRALYAAGAGDASAPLALDVEVPVLTGVSPSAAWQGDTVRVRVRGASLYLYAPVATASLGPGVEVLQVDVRDVSTADLLVRVAPDAPIGARTLQVGGAQGVFGFAQAFSVLPGDDRPRVIDVSPSHGVQAETVAVTVEASRPFAGPVTVDGGPGLLLASDVVVSGGRASFDLLVRGDAPPGARTLVLDDGGRLWEAPFVVREIFVRERACAQGGGAGGLAGPLGLGLVLAATRRRDRVS